MSSHCDSGGIQSYKGYEYQIIATVWVALHLIIEHNQCDQIEIEPASQEDIEAALDVAPENAEITVGVASGPIKLWIQIKLKTGEYWTPSQIKSMITNSGLNQRMRALEAMETEPQLIFNLITSSQANRDLRGFVVEDLGPSHPTKIPNALTPHLTPEKACRVGILEQLVPNRIELQIKEILRGSVHVPSSRHRECLMALSNAVRGRILGQEPSQFIRDEIMMICRKFGGFPATFKVPLVEPTNADDIRQQLDKHWGILLSGPSGIGKTLFARRLVFEYQIKDDPFEIIQAEDPSIIENHLADQGNILFFIEDPFGLYKLSEKVDRWTTELPRIFQKARPDKRIICTSRTSMIHMADSVMPEAIRLYIASIEEENYTKAMRAEIIGHSLENASLEKKDFVLRHENKILNHLLVPYSLSEFSRSLRSQTQPLEKVLDTLISDASTEAISRKLAQEVEAAGVSFISGAVLVWALLMGKKRITLADVKQARGLVRKADKSLKPSADQVFDFLIRTDRLKPRNEEEYDAHPSVLEGLESLLTRSPEISEDSIIALLEGYIIGGLREEAFQIISSLHGRNLPIPATVRKAIDHYLRDHVLLICKGKASKAFYDFDKWYSGDDSLAIIIHAFMAPMKKMRWGLQVWQPPDLSAEQISQISGSEEAKIAAKKFIQLVLPYTSAHEYSETLLSFLSQFGWDLSCDFKDACLVALRNGAYPNVEVLIKGACVNSSFSLDIINAAIEEIMSVQKWWEKFSKNEYWKARQGYYDADYSDNIMYEPGERFYVPEYAIESAIALRRKKDGYRWILQHPQREFLAKYWAKSIDGPCDQQELVHLHQISPAEDRPKVWRAIVQGMRKDLTGLIFEDLQTSSISHLDDFLDVLAQLLTPSEWANQMKPVVAKLSLSKQAEMVWVINGKKDFLEGGKYADFRLILDDVLDFKVKKAIDVARRVLSKGTDDESLAQENFIKETLAALACSGSENIALLATNALYFLNQPIGDFLSRFLLSEDPEIRSNALQFIDFNISEDNRRFLVNALNDPDYKCRRSAMKAITREGAEGEYRKRVIDMASDPSAPVREVCAHLIGEHLWGEGIPALLELIKDRRSKGPPGYMRGNPDFHVAREAVAALTGFGQLPETAVNQILLFLEEKPTKLQDLEVIYGLCGIMAAQESDQIMPFLVRCLNDKRYMQGHKDEGFPIRYAAAWGIMRKLCEAPDLHNQLDIAILARNAMHSDGRLAGPCLLALGMVGESSTPYIEILRQGSSLTAERALLFLLGNKIIGKSIEKTSAGLIPPQYSGKFLLTIDIQNISPNQWRKVRNFLSSIKGQDDIRPTLRCAAYLLFGDEVKDLANCNDIKAGHFAAQIPVMTTRTLSGGE